MSDEQEFAQQPAAPEQESAKPGAPPQEAPKPPGCAAPMATHAPFAPKNIVVCCDGTGNAFAVEDSKNSNSNVVKLYTALDLNATQIGYYHPGVGTMGDPTRQGWRRQLSRINGLAFGAGFKDNVLDAYRYLMQHYTAGDKVYLFGFSRGAYTARALAGLLHGYGLLCRGNEGHLLYAWSMYTAKVKQQRQDNKRTVDTDFSFRDTFSHKDFIIHFVGLWDTVSAVGWISTQMRLLHLAENPSILTGRHAVSIDERRAFYQDNLWGAPVPVQVPPVLRNTPDGRAMDKVQDLVQVWFAGAHSDIGGSYPQLDSGLANITLEWMLREATEAGIRPDPARMQAVLGKSIDCDPNHLTDQLAPLYERPKRSMLHKSLYGLWWLLELFPHRYYDRDDTEESMRIPLGARRTLPRHAIVHSTVKHRLKSDVCYRPPNVTLAEIEEAAVNPAPTVANLAGYFQFEPQVCTDRNWRSNGLVVFLVSLLEIALGLYLLAKLSRGLVSLVRASAHGVQGLVHRAPLWAADLHRLLSQAEWWTLIHLWPVLLALCILLVRTIVVKARQVT